MGESESGLALQARKWGKEGKHEQAFLTCWGFIELTVDVAVRDEFNIPDIADFADDSEAIEGIIPREDFLLEAPFVKKLGFLKKTGYLTKAEWKAIDKFREARNKIVHHYLDSPLSAHSFSPTDLGLKEREEILVIGIKAVRAAGDALTRRNKEQIRRAKEASA